MTINKIKQIFFTPSRIDTNNKSKARPSIQSVYRTRASANIIYKLCPKAKYKCHTRHLTASKNMQLVGPFCYFCHFGDLAGKRTSFFGIFSFFGQMDEKWNEKCLAHMGDKYNIFFLVFSFCVYLLLFSLVICTCVNVFCRLHDLTTDSWMVRLVISISLITFHGITWQRIVPRKF